jgi:hypothetical protein
MNRIKTNIEIDDPGMNRAVLSSQAKQRRGLWISEYRCLSQSLAVVYLFLRLFPIFPTGFLIVRCPFKYMVSAQDLSHLPPRLLSPTMQKEPGDDYVRRIAEFILQNLLEHIHKHSLVLLLSVEALLHPKDLEFLDG